MNQIHFHRRNLPHIYRPHSTYFITFRLYGSIPQIKINELRNRKEFNTDFKTKEEQYKSYEKYFEEYDLLLDNNRKIDYLKNPQIAKIVKNSLQYFDNKYYKLICFTIMPNHVHLVFYLLDFEQASKSELNITQKFVAGEKNTVTQTFQSERKTIVTQTFQSERKNTETQSYLSAVNPKINRLLHEENKNISKILQSIKGYSAREANRVLNRKGNFWQSESYDHIIRDEDELLQIINYVIYNPVKANLVNIWKNWEYTYLADDW